MCPLPFEKSSSTRWLICGKIMYNVLVNWKELEAYFAYEESALSNSNAKYKAKLLKEMLLDYKNYLFFQFVTPMVQEFERLNSLFQQTKSDPHELNKELFMHHKSLQSRLYKDNGVKKDINEVDFGVKFLTECDNYLKENTEESSSEIICVKEDYVHVRRSPQSSV